MQREDTDPWYRQFWPWFIIALPASAVVAGLYTLWLAGQTTDSLVIRTDEGVNVVTERNLAAEQEALR
ncbi:MAG: FixH family protein, partial [Woeseiaceae bacterium]|nr:FixH family protein [Woeseiaceae bacterium]